MIRQREVSESIQEQDQEDARQHKVYPPLSDNTNMFRLLVFLIAMVTLLAFAVVCLVFVGGTGGWISFCAASFAILVIASTFIAVKREG